MSGFHSLCAAVLIASLLLPSCTGAEADGTWPEENAHEFDLDFSGVELFWGVHDTLAADRDPSEAAWGALFSTPGYALLDERERRGPALREAFRSAYMPSRKEGSTSEGWVAYVLPHLREVPPARAKLRSFTSELAAGGLFQMAVDRAQTLLPEGFTDADPAPPVSFIFFAPDGRGYERIVLDLLHLMRHPDAAGYLAHEFHHAYRARLGPEHAPFGDDLLAWALVRVENEGIADRLDKAEVPWMTDAQLAVRYPDPQRRAYYEGYRRAFHDANTWLAWVEGHLGQIARRPDAYPVLGEELYEGLPDAGRAMGSYMAAVILEHLGREALVDVVGDPFGFWVTYNEAARASDGSAHVLSPEALSMIVSLRGRYVKRDGLPGDHDREP